MISPIGNLGEYSKQLRVALASNGLSPTATTAAYYFRTLATR